VRSNDAAFRDYIAALRNSDGSFQETAPKKTTENTVRHRGGGSMVANHRSGGESSMVVTTLGFEMYATTCPHLAWSCQKPGRQLRTDHYGGC